MRVLLCLGLLYFRLALLADTTIAMEADYDAVFSDELSAELTPCRSWTFPCGNGVHQCTSQDRYYFFYLGPQPGCPIDVNFTTTPPPEGTCALANNTCRFVEEVPTCVSWLRDCDNEYSCTSEEEYEVAMENETVCSFPASRPPPPNSVCVPVNNSCEWRNPCRMWQNWCGWEYRCGSEAQKAAFQHGPQPICAYPPSRANQLVPVGECVYQNNTCEWSECRSWLSPCRTSWMCGSDYEYRVAQALPPPPCPFPGEDFVPPAEPGVCKYDLVSEQCQFQEEPVCTGGQEYQTCGSPCPRTCDNYQIDLLCIQYCVQGCFCPGSTVLHEGECIPSDQCPGEDPCDAIDCQSGYECQIFNETGEAFCSPNCEDLDPCEPQEQCVITAVTCVRAPCPGVLSCEPATCTGGMEWQECGTACPRTCDNYNSDFGCTEQCVQGCFCPEGTVLHEGECVIVSDCPNYTTPCALIRCPAGHICQVQGLTGYCEPSCEPPSNSLLCGEGERCELLDQDCEGREPCPRTFQCVAETCTGGMEWQDCGSACPLTCANYTHPALCTRQCVPGCSCPQGTVLDGEECVPFSECPDYITPCASTLCLQGHTCKVYELTNEAYCEPVCTPPLDALLCEEGKNCTLLEGDCRGQQPCPHTYQCLPLEACKAWRSPCFNQTWVCGSYESYQQFRMEPQRRCPIYGSSPLPGQCVLVGGTCQFTANCTGGKEWKECGTACPLTCDNYNTDFACTEQCVEGCFCPEGKVELDGVCLDPSMCSGCDNCQEGEVCSVLTTDGFQHPHVVCKGPTAVPCSPETSLACPSNSRCLTHNITGTSFCLESCYLQNGGCSDEQVCYSEREDENCNPLLESCFKTTCTDIPDTLGTCPIGWEHSGCASACPTTCEDYLEPQLRLCSAVCAPCECPRGMVVFRDRCVDPLECYTLMTESALNPLPQPEDVLLIQITIIGVSSETFDSSQFAISVQKIFEALGFNLQVETYAVLVEDRNTAVVLRLKGGDVKPGLMAGLIMDNRDAFSVNIAAVSTVNTPSATEEPNDDDDDDDSDDVPIGIVVGSVVAVTVVCSLLLLALIIIVLVIMRSLKTKDVHLEVSAEEKQKSVDYLSFANLDSKNYESS